MLLLRDATWEWDPIDVAYIAPADEYDEAAAFFEQAAREASDAEQLANTIKNKCFYWFGEYSKGSDYKSCLAFAETIWEIVRQ